jgi:hypothetical protein
MKKETIEEKIEKPVILVPRLKGIMMITSGILHANSISKENPLFLYVGKDNWAPGVRLFNDLPNLDSNGHADTYQNFDRMIAKMSGYSPNLEEITREINKNMGSYRIPLHIRPEVVIQEVTDKEYHQRLSLDNKNIPKISLNHGKIYKLHNVS